MKIIELARTTHIQTLSSIGALSPELYRKMDFFYLWHWKSHKSNVTILFHCWKEKKEKKTFTSRKHWIPSVKRQSNSSMSQLNTKKVSILVLVDSWSLKALIVALKITLKNRFFLNYLQKNYFWHEIYSFQLFFSPIHRRKLWWIKIVTKVHPQIWALVEWHRIQKPNCWTARLK